MQLAGLSLLGFGTAAVGAEEFHAVDPATGNDLEPAFHSAQAADVETATRLAAAAAPVLGRKTGAERGIFLRALADRIAANAPALSARAQQETALPAARCESEIGRTCQQLRLFAAEIERGDWVDARIETAQPDRKPLPKPDHRSMLQSIGPVAVFGASNFPFAFSVAGGDTASAFAAGNPVIVKAHPAHPGVSALVGRLVVDTVRACGWPEGSFSLLFDSGHAIGQALVRHPLVRAVGFTGSARGGRALMDLAAARPDPIPVFAEMGSINPVFILPGAWAERGNTIVDGLYASTTAGVGQFCTNPGLIVLERSPNAEGFLAQLAKKIGAISAAPMLSRGICASFLAATKARSAEGGIRSFAAGASPAGGTVAPQWFESDAAHFLANETLAEEIFGPSSLVVWCRDRAERLAVARRLHGGLTATVHATVAEAAGEEELFETLAAKAGRILFNGFPTGVEVSAAMVHGGPFPASSDARTTSVGTRSLVRFARLVCWQGFPNALLPAALQDANPLGLLRQVDGVVTRDPVH